MKKGLLLIVLLTFGWVGIASAVPTTWTDELTFGNGILIPPTYSYFHDISDDGFNHPPATVDSFELEIGIHDDNVGKLVQKWWGSYYKSDGGEQPMVTFSLLNSYWWNAANQTYEEYADSLWDFSWIADLYDDGTLNVSVSSVWGDFYLDYSNLTVNGDDGSAPVPEPGTLLLLGSGLAGLAIYRRKKMK